MSDALVATNRPKYFAFLSYAHKDARTAAVLSRYLETFRVPVRLGGKEQQLPKRMYPIFRDRDEFSASSDLGAAIQGALASSGALIVLCSPDAAKSKWVDAEIRTFRRVGNSRRIFPVLLQGEPSGAFPPALIEEEHEPLAVDFRPRKDVLRDARLRLVAALLGVDFDSLKRRETLRVRQARVRTAALASFIALVTFGFPAALLIYNAIQPKITEYSTPTRDSLPNGITTGRDGAIWFTETVDRLGRATIGYDGRVSITEYSTPTRNSGPSGITTGRDGALWFTEYDASKIGRVTIGHDGRVSVTEYPTPIRSSDPSNITAGVDGKLWFIGARFRHYERVKSLIGRVVIGRDGQVKISEYPVPMRDGDPTEIMVGAHGVLWVASYGDSTIGRVAIGLDGTVSITEYPTPTRNSGPSHITTGPDGALWFTEYNTSKIARIAIGGNGRASITEYSTPTGNSRPSGITTGPDGALWFTEAMTSQIGRAAIGHDGNVSIAEYPTTRNSGPDSITAGPDGALWFTENSSKVGRITTGFRSWR